MVIIKTPEQIEGIKKSCRLLAKVMKEVGQSVKPGASTRDLNMLAEKIIEQAGGRPAFKGYRGAAGVGAFPTALCASVNDIVVHGPATSGDPLKEGDILGIDCGIELDGYYSDMAVTFPVGKISREARRLLDITEKALKNGIKAVKPGNQVYDISKAIQDTVLSEGYGIIRDYAGHGVGVDIHEDPWIPNFVNGRLKTHLNIELKPGMIFALEPMISTGGEDVQILDDGWSVRTADGSLTAHFEHTVLVTEKGYEILTK